MAFAGAAAQGDAIAEAYENGDYSKAMRLIMELADRANPYIEQNAPWELKKDPERAQDLQDICTVGLNLFRQLVVYLAPVLPRFAEQTGALLDAPLTSWDDAQTPLTGSPVAKFKHMMQRVEAKGIEAIIEESREEAAAAAKASATPSEWDDSDEAITAAPIADEMRRLLADPAEIDRMLSAGAERASEIAERTMNDVRDIIGLIRSR